MTKALLKRGFETIPVIMEARQFLNNPEEDFLTNNGTRPVYELNRQAVFFGNLTRFKKNDALAIAYFNEKSMRMFEKSGFDFTLNYPTN